MVLDQKYTNRQNKIARIESDATATSVHLTFCHLNDVYEIIPVSGGRLGGLARVAALRKELARANPNTRVFFGGDLYNPSGLGGAWVDGVRLDGKQAVAVMNRVGVDYMTFGDHEINTVNDEQFAQRLAETHFQVISSNVFAPDGVPFASGRSTVVKNDIFTVTNARGDALRVGVFGLTKPIRLPQMTYVYVDWRTAAAEQVALLGNQVDLLIALTHLPQADDEWLAANFPAIDLILGGDEHQHLKVAGAANRAPIYKADSNARSVYILDLFYDTASGDLQIVDHLQPITDGLADDPETLAETDFWVERAFATFRAAGWEPTEVVGYAPLDLDGFEAAVRSHPTPYTHLITQAMQNAVPGAALAIVCSWAIRLDDLLPAGSPITRYDIWRTFSYGLSPVYAVETPASLLAEILDFGRGKVGSGSYLLTTPNVIWGGDGWQIDGAALDGERSYLVAMADDLLDDYLFYISPARAGEVRCLGAYGDIGQALVAELQRR
jgi:5'-nucleotidase/UDP-sugar diphosphatase